MRTLRTTWYVSLVLSLAACAGTDGKVPTEPASQPPRPGSVALGHREAAEVSNWDNTAISYHGGPVVASPKVAVLYWSTKAIFKNGPVPESHGAGSADGSLVGYYLRNIGGSHYFAMVSGYGGISNSVNYTQYWASSVNAPGSGSNVSANDIAAKLKAGFDAGMLTYDVNTSYLVFTDTTVNQNFDQPIACANHGFITIASPYGGFVNYAALPYPNFAYGTPPTDPCTQGGHGGANSISPNNDQPAEAAIYNLNHELTEIVTDPRQTAWYDIAQNSYWEIADKCQWQWGNGYLTSNGGIANVNLGTNGGKDFELQELWASNSAQCYLPSYWVDSVPTSPTPAVQYTPFTMNFYGFGFDVTNAKVWFTQNCNPGSPGCMSSMMGGNYLSKSRTQIAFSTTLGQSGYIWVWIDNTGTGQPSAAFQITVNPIH